MSTNNHHIIDTILLIDDDAPTNFLNSIIIKKSNICAHVEVKDSALKALEWLKNNDSKPDLIFLDINMPMMSGWEFLQEYDKLPKEQQENTELVMLTTSLNPKDKERAALHKSVSYFLNKPLTIEKVTNFIQEIILQSKEG